jgi:hypothetical protein
MTQTSKNIILTLFILIVAIVATFGYIYDKKSFENSTVVAIKQSQPDWINVEQSKLPLFFPEGIPLAQNSAVTLDRYYVDNVNTVHGEFVYTIIPPSQFSQSEFISFYKNWFINNKWVINQNIDTGISASMNKYKVQVTFKNLSTTTVEIDITYAYAQ